MINGRQRVPAAGAGPGLLAGVADDRAERRGAARATSSCRWRPASTGPGCTRRCSRSGSSTTPTGSAIWCGASSATGAPAWVASTPTTSSRPRSFVAQWLEVVRRDRNHPPHHRLVPAERDPPAAARPDHPARRRHPRRCSGDQAGRHDPAGAGRRPATPTACRDRRLGQPQLRAGPGAVRGEPGRPGERTPVRQPARRRGRSRSRTRASRTSSASSAASGGTRTPGRRRSGADRVLGLRAAGARRGGASTPASPA